MVGEDGSTGAKSDPVVISAPPAATVTVDPQNPLPEPSFFWRRVITMVLSFGLLALAWLNAYHLHDLGVSDDLLTFAQWCIALNGFVLLCYFVGPSAAELVSMIQSARIIRSSLDMATSADKNATDASISAGNNADRAGFRAAQRDSAPQTDQDSRFAGEAPDAAPTGVPETADEIDFAPRGKA
jgi:hypothetical protein